MYAYVSSLQGRTVTTVVEANPNTVVRVTARRALVRTRTGENWVSLQPLQDLAARVYAGEEVAVTTRERSAFYVAILVTRPEIAHALNPRRVWLKDSVSTFDAEYADLFPDEDRTTASEGRARYRHHRVTERSPLLRRAKIQAVLASGRSLSCEACGFDFEARYGPLGRGFVECHHRVAIAAGGERETSLDDLVLLCANCHRMIHRTVPMASVEDFRAHLR